jgi:hypothetical protein
MLYIDGKTVVDNDGLHAPRARDSMVKLTKGKHDLTITFYENGGGSMLEVLWTPTPGGQITRLTHTYLSNNIGCPCHAGLFFEAYTPGSDFNFHDLKSKEETILNQQWAGWKPIVHHAELQGRIYYSNDKAFVKEIPVGDHQSSLLAARPYILY